MTTRIVALLTGVAMLTAVGAATAQAPSSPVLNTLEVEKLVASDAPSDHALLGAHFAALGNRQETDAARHAAMARAYARNPRRSLNTGMQAHCRRLADLATQSAATLRELTAYHNTLAKGTPATAPTAGARFDAGAGARAPSSEELHALAMKAEAPADHRALAEYFQSTAARSGADADTHATMASSLRGGRQAAAARHHDRLATLAREAAQEATAAAKTHTDTASSAK
jgi:hypothetical protein